MTCRVRVLRSCYGPIESKAGAVWPGDVLRCAAGHIQRPLFRDRDFLSDPCFAPGCREIAFSEPAPAGYRWLGGTRFHSGPRKWAAECPTCGADYGEPCRAVGRVCKQGQAMESTHAARKRRTHGESPRARFNRYRETTRKRKRISS